ncbi:amino acid transporter [Micrococcales bacterium 31B]|nr:amino acid transporter [Micrococcales bacterium 31B]
MFALTGQGLLAGFGLIAAIGAQNAFVLRQGALRSRVLLVVLICTLSDVALMAAGVAGMGVLFAAAPWIITVMKVAGAAFLLWYAVLSARRALKSEHLDVAAAGRSASARSIALTTLAFTWLNPHVYLDTVVLLGVIANAHGDGRWWFIVGAMAASAIWFSALGFGARVLTPLVAKPLFWKVLDGLIAVFMAFLAVKVLLS